MSPRTMRWLLNLYPPYLGAGVHIDSISRDWRELVVSMPLRFYNRNYVGSHFGGSLYSMIDPHLMLLLMKLLGKRYLVWDYEAHIRFKKPGKGRVKAHFQIQDDVLETITAQTESGQKYLHTFDIPIMDPHGEIVAEAQKTLYFRLKQH